MIAFDFKLMVRLAHRSIFELKDMDSRCKSRRIAMLLINLFFYGLSEMIHWTCFFLDEFFFPDYRQVDVIEPVFIAGLPRSGTTHMHRLMAKDPQFTSFRLWEILLAPSIVQKKFYKAMGVLDRKLGSPISRFIDKFEKAAFKNKFHEIGLFKPEEDDPILLHIFSSFFLVFMFPFDEDVRRFSRFDLEIPAAERARIMKFYKQCVQRHLYVFGKDKRFLSKNPAFSPKIRSIGETFPDAKVIYMARNPLQAVASGMSFRSFLLDHLYFPLSPEAIQSLILQNALFFYTHPLEILSAWQENRHAFVNYDSLIADSEKTVLDVYHRFGLNVSTPYRRALSLDKIRSFAYRSRHCYAPEDFGISRDTIISLFKQVFDKFGFDMNSGENLNSESLGPDQDNDSGDFVSNESCRM
ncbi:MAG: sulfotransferase [Deltaproteobacteria bacterium]|nr:sulfotransferase [Deltaproteobacteria bacterium]